MSRKTTIYFNNSIYGNYQDNYYTDAYVDLINKLQENPIITWSGNLGVTDGVVVENKFTGDFTKVNCAVVIHPIQGTHIYRIIKKIYTGTDTWQVTMVKDVISANYNNILSSKVLVSRLGIPRTIPDPLLFIDEQMQMSEIKTNHEIINELVNCKSYGYLAIWKRDSLDGTIEWNSSMTPSRRYDISVDKLNDLPIYNNGPVDILTSRNVKVRTATKSSISGHGTLVRTGIVVSAEVNPETQTTRYVYNVEIQDLEVIVREVGVTDRFGGTLITGFNANEDVSLDRLTAILLTKNNGGQYVNNYNIYQGKIVFERSTGKYYELNLGTPYNNNISTPVSTEDIETIFGNREGTARLPYWAMSYYVQETSVKYEFTELPYMDEPLKHTFLPYNNTVDQPFQMLFMPMIEQGTFTYNGNEYTTNRITTEHLMYDLISTYAGDNAKLVDVQIIPYSPIDGYANSWNGTTYNLDTSNVKEVIIVGDNVIPIFEVGYASYSKSIDKVITVEDYKLTQKEKYVLTSPSGAGNYEFSIAKNGGLKGFYIKIDLRPYSSFHSLQPMYGNIYGSNYNDTRGLIWQEDTSLTQITDAWETYKRQNINYLNSFNGEQDYKRSQQVLQHEANWGNFGFDAGKRLVEAGVQAASFVAEATANDFWGVKGGAAGAVGATAIMVGAIASEAIEAGQLAYNNHMENRLLDNEISYYQQQFNYQIGNIRALPENIEKVSGTFQTNNYVPYLQVFKPTEEETLYFQEYLDTYGVNIGMMVNLESKSFDYLQGTLLVYSQPITNDEYTEICARLAKGTRKYGGV